jgi:hypothetical protein
MLTQEEGAKIRDIKSREVAHTPIKRSEQQWDLDLVRREGIAIRKQAADNAHMAGFNIEGIKTI